MFWDGEGLTSLKDGMLPSAFVALIVFMLIGTLDNTVPPVWAIIDSLATWWLATLFLVTLKDGLLDKKKEGQ